MKSSWAHQWPGFALTLGAGAVLGWASLRGFGQILRHRVFDRTNYRGHHLPTAGGLVLVLALFAGSSVAALGGAYLGEESPLAWATADATVRSLASVLLLSSFAMLGLLDDLTGEGQSYGFIGHFRALGRGEVTSGAIKALGGPAVALGLAPFFGARSIVEAVLIGAGISLWANVGNLFDRAPGRTIKVSTLAQILVIGTGTSLVVPGAFAVVFVLGATLAIGSADLGERLMLGDSGSNLLGASVGLACVLWHGPLGWAIAAGLALCLNLASEAVSFSKVISATPGLRQLDAVGRIRTQ